MRTQKATLNSISNLLSFIILLAPNFWVRKVFLEELGDTLLGIHYLFQNIISFLSLMELGVGIAIMYALYKPIADNSRAIIKGYLVFFQKLYWTIGLFIVIGGLFLIPILPLLSKDKVSNAFLTPIFLIFLGNTITTYLFSYKLTLLQASQNGYVVTIVQTVFRLFVLFLQLGFLKITSNYYHYLFIQLALDILFFIVINLIIDTMYPWLKKTEARLPTKDKKELIKNIKAVFFHKIGAFIVLGTDNILISKFVGLTSVALFNNYYMVLKMLETLVNRLFSGVIASIGNLLVTEDSTTAYKIHQRLYQLNFFIASTVVVTLWNTIDQFIVIWLGEDYLLPKVTLSVILFNLYFRIMRFSVEHFKEGSGLYYQDRFAPIAESIINLGASIILVHYIGLTGIFLGTVLSNILVIFWVKPLIVYSHIFKVKLFHYFVNYSKYLIILLLELYVSTLMTDNIKSNFSAYGLLINILINLVITMLINIVLFHKSNEFKGLLSQLKLLIHKIKTK